MATDHGRLSANVNRRHMTQGQRAMALVKAGDLAAKSRSSKDAASALEVSRPLVSQANIVLKYAPDLTDQVLSGALSLDAAYEEARKTPQRANAAPQRDDAPDMNLRRP